jgi:hypothetical protein
MDIDEVERCEWACKNLRVLRIRFKGLDTKKKVLKAIVLWRAGRWRASTERGRDLGDGGG